MTACVALLSFPALAEEDASISHATRDVHGHLTHSVESEYQAGPTEIRVLLPHQVAADKRLPVVYVLPVESGRESRFGDGLLEVEKRDLHNRFQAIFVAPTFSQLPWYADHPTKPDIRQESYVVDVVVPFIEKTYPASDKRDDRLLLGFSKSGWGAWTLLLRHPEMFGRAAAWDAPLMMEESGKYGTGDIFGTQETFEKHRPASLLKQNAELLRTEKRLILTGYGNFREHHQQMHMLLDTLVIPHEYRDGPLLKHDWPSGWVSEAVELLIDPATRAREVD